MCALRENNNIGHVVIAHVVEVLHDDLLSFSSTSPSPAARLVQVQERFRIFLEAMLCRIDADHWLNRPEPVSSAPEPEPDVSPPPAEGRADDGVRSLAVHALVVGHGAYIRCAVRHLLRELRCSGGAGLRRGPHAVPVPQHRRVSLPAHSPQRPGEARCGAGPVCVRPQSRPSQITSGGGSLLWRRPSKLMGGGKTWSRPFQITRGEVVYYSADH